MMAHKGPIHDIQPIPNEFSVGTVTNKPELAAKMKVAQEVTKFATCSSDRTIRMWNFIDPNTSSERQKELQSGLQRNAYCKDLSRIVFVPSAIEGAKNNFAHFKVEPP